MTALGIVLLIRSRLKNRPRVAPPPPVDRAPSLAQRVIFAALLVFALTIPGNWTQDVPARYGKRHPGLHHSALYPAIDTSISSGQRAQTGPATRPPSSPTP